MEINRWFHTHIIAIGSFLNKWLNTHMARGRSNKVNRRQVRWVRLKFFFFLLSCSPSMMTVKTVWLKKVWLYSNTTLFYCSFRQLQLSLHDSPDSFFRKCNFFYSLYLHEFPTWPTALVNYLKITICCYFSSTDATLRPTGWLQPTGGGLTAGLCPWCWGLLMCGHTWESE